MSRFQSLGEALRVIFQFHLEHAEKWGTTMASGKVKWFDNKKGFGFIAQDSGPDIFVHHRSIMGDGYKTLNEGDAVSFDPVTSEKGLKAENVQRISAA